MKTPINQDTKTLLRQLLAKQAKNETDIQRIWKKLDRLLITPSTISKP